jgi:dTDP-glucose pyrophosphorylase
MIPLNDALFIGLNATVKDAIAALEGGEQGIALLVDSERRLIGLLTDHDLRKALLNGAGLQTPIEPYINRSPVVAMADQPREEIFELMRRTGRSPVPLLNASGHVVGLESLSSILKPGWLAEHIAVVMAGGLGTRLRPLTLGHPKPMLPVQGKPILEIILENLKAYGFQRVYISVHFQREMIEEHFGDGQRLGLQIEYLREGRPLGTAGALALLPDRPTRPFVVMNGDLLTYVNMESLMNYHVQSGGRLTMCVRAYELQIPFGVVRMEESRVVALEEKPVHGCFVNAGIYVLDPEVLGLIPGPEPLDMTDLIGKAITQLGSVNSFPIHEYWLDVGQHEAYERACHDYRFNR